MWAGNLDRRVTLQRFTTARNAFGAGAKTYTTLATVWASKRPISDAERLKYGIVSAKMQYRFQIRWSTSVADLDPKDRLVCEGVTYEIWGVKELGRREGLEISATAKADD